MLGFDRITFDPEVMGGRACIRGMRIAVSLIVNLVANDMGAEEIIESYPYLEPEDIQQALHYAAWLAEDAIQPSEWTLESPLAKVTSENLHGELDFGPAVGNEIW